MGFRKTFPATASVCRKLASKTARRSYISALGILLLLSAYLHLEAYLFARRVQKTLTAVSQVRVGKTTKAELLAMIPELKPRPREECPQGECYGSEINTLWLSSKVPEILSPAPDPFWHLVVPLDWLGARFGRAGADFVVRADRVESIDAGLLISNGSADYPGLVSVGATSRTGLVGWNEDAFDESPEYSVRHLNKFRDLAISVSYTPQAAPELVAHFYHPDLRCLWGLRGCRIAEQMVPEVEQDRLKIQAAMLRRLQSGASCTGEAIRRRVRDMDVFAIIEGTADSISRDCGSRQVAVRTITVLKGKMQRPLEKLDLYGVFYTWDKEGPKPDPGLTLLFPNRRWVVLAGSQDSGWANINGPCDAVPATPENMAIIESALKQLPRSPSPN